MYNYMQLLYIISSYCIMFPNDCFPSVYQKLNSTFLSSDKMVSQIIAPGIHLYCFLFPYLVTQIHMHTQNVISCRSGCRCFFCSILLTVCQLNFKCRTGASDFILLISCFVFLGSIQGRKILWNLKLLDKEGNNSMGFSQTG